MHQTKVPKIIIIPYVLACIEANGLSSSFCLLECIVFITYVLLQSNVTNQASIQSCYVYLKMMNVTKRNNSTRMKICSETRKIISFDITPGESYNYSIVIINIAGSFTINGSIGMPLS